MQTKLFETSQNGYYMSANTKNMDMTDNIILYQSMKNYHAFLGNFSTTID
jgi:hypothetical protein